ncbi:MAG: efflux RND transporter periplasmic adaptor subunit [Capnocytophaga sp.]|nr:efflux RND transporter periplasmic adaptor subunit [Capnocytophaga sp.]
MNKNIKKIIIVALLALVAFGVYYFFMKEQPTLIVLQTDKVTQGDVTTEVTATGSVQPVDEVEVGTQVSGLVSKIYVDYNSQVKKGQLLAELDKTNLQENVINATANYNSALNELNYYQQNYDRQKKMFDAQVISKSDYEQALYQLTNAKTMVTQRLTSLNQAKTNLGYANIYAPIDGIVLSKEVEEGQTVAASMSAPTLFKIAKDIKRMQVEVNVDEADIGQVKVGQRVSFTVDAYPQEEFSGKVTQVRLSPTTTSNVVTYTVIVEAENPDEKLKPGLTATIAIFTNELKNVTIIPAKAINFTPDTDILAEYYQQKRINTQIPKIEQSKGKNKFIWIVNPDGSLSQKEVTIGSNDGINVQVVSGLSVGETVATALQSATPDVATGEKKSGDSDSPFMPKRPQRNNSKAK